MTAVIKQPSASEKLQVFYDGSCPLCAREIAFYQRRQGSDAVCWVDVADRETLEVTPGLSKDEALARFHVKKSDGSLVSGGAAFAELWAALPGFRTLGRLAQRPVFVWVLNGSYDVFLKFRPFLQRLAAKT